MNWRRSLPFFETARSKEERYEPAEEVGVEDMVCIRCDGRLRFLGGRDFHEGTRAWGFVLGDLGELFTGGTTLLMYGCESCGHIEFFAPER